MDNQTPDKKGKDSAYIVTKLEQRVLEKHGGKADPSTHHWNLTEGDSAMHFEAAVCIKELVRMLAAKEVSSAKGHIVIPEELRRLAELANELCVSLDSEAEDIGGMRSSGEILKEFGPATDAAFEVLDRTGNRSPR